MTMKKRRASRATELTVPNYGIRVFWSEKDRGFMAVCDELPEISAFGETQQDAVREFGIALQAVAEVYAEDGDEMPTARTVERIYSGKLNVRLDKSVHREAAQFAEIQGVSLNQFIQNAVVRECGRREGRIESENTLQSLRNEVAHGVTKLFESAVTNAFSRVYIRSAWSTNRASTPGSAIGSVVVPIRYEGVN